MKFCLITQKKHFHFGEIARKEQNMFWETFYSLCNNKNTTPSKVVLELKIATGSITKWKNGSNPSGKTLQKIADYFGVTVDYLLGKEAVQSQEDQNTVIIRGRDGSYSKKTLTDEQIKMLQAMINSLPEAPDDL